MQGKESHIYDCWWDNWDMLEVETIWFNGLYLMRHIKTGSWALWQEHEKNPREGEANYQPHIIHVGSNLMAFVEACQRVSLYRFTEDFGALRVAPSHWGSRTITVHYTAAPMATETPGAWLLGKPTYGNYATIGYEQSILAMYLAARYGLDYAKEWHRSLPPKEKFYGKYVPGEDWQQKDLQVWKFGRRAHQVQTVAWCVYCAKATAAEGEEYCPQCKAELA